METCENCGETIGELETAFVANNHVVCTKCKERLSAKSFMPKQFILLGSFVVVATILVTWMATGHFASAPLLVPTPSTALAPPQPTMDDFKRFLAQLLPAMRSQPNPDAQKIREMFRSKETDANAPIIIDGDALSLIDTDLVKQNSLIYPVAGVAIIRDSFWMGDAKTGQKATVEAWDATITFVRETDGTWRPTAELTKLQCDIGGSALGHPGEFPNPLHAV